MTRFQVTRNGRKEFIKNIDYANETLAFTTNPSEAYQRSTGYYATAEKDFISHHFAQAYPEVKKIVLA